MNKRSIQSFAGGIIFATTIMAGYQYFIENPSSISLEEAKKIIEDHGMTITTKEVNQESKKTSEEKKAPLKTETNKDKEPKESSKVVENENQSSTVEKEEEKASSFTLKIEPGMNPETISSILEKQGIIQEKSAFTEYLEKNNLSTKVQLGEYVLTKNMSISQIAKTITN